MRLRAPDSSATPDLADRLDFLGKLLRASLSAGYRPPRACQIPIELRHANLLPTARLWRDTVRRILEVQYSLFIP